MAAPQGGPTSMVSVSSGSDELVTNEFHRCLLSRIGSFPKLARCSSLASGHNLHF